MATEQTQEHIRNLQLINQENALPILMMQEIHGQVGVDENGYPVYVSNTSEPQSIRAPTEGRSGFLQLHHGFDNTR
ncbi:Oidioi.mRNA.OKI2018_I69.PAR.g9704.t1.cds [Oikopleura dioica]|uniref:Oidioi.mRNA.OKI2018_I69.PAR.g9704.t1.cds n=1 Tax=Oikopleura dioica TaxID=34765 RepID=A0ABN7RQZ7_OIKDI|nr:Oidioi.mRNA.OKI2018_I69.PAR.g9704.t1.cds [Oikopleura dioica]